MKERIQELAARNRSARTLAEKNAVASEMEALRAENPEEFTIALEDLIKSTAKELETLTIAEKMTRVSAAADRL